ncbi:hypothetical protein MUN81_03335 [Hymenobacter sp. 5317J-9]|uniref:hypothetical protein n=1 Tax=Hymenobacter sp. 5317J-9 TaxID=2932250 RepID=UPI001FD6D37F|nr:hypothetical protein [Hymenobacter sp. 5317J-9]UOQ98529.1 hypothetical protein MUN81_03335 [Hymenobacter sp. 5317J-9]
MQKFGFLLLLLLFEAVVCRAQEGAEKLKYQLVEAILEELPTQFAYAKLGPDGLYHRLPPMVTDTPVVRLLLLDHPYSTDLDYRIVLAEDGTYERTQLLKYFTAADVAYMRQQLPASKLFRFEQAKFREPWVTVVSLDTMMALNKRLRRETEFSSSNLLLQRYGNDRTTAVWGILLSKNHKRALVNVGGDGWRTSVYVKRGTTWYKETDLFVVAY